MRKTSNHQGFTLLELLVVVVIVAILTVLALPYYQNAVQSARASEAVIWWGHSKRFLRNNPLTQAQANRHMNNTNENNPMKYFMVSLVCRIKEGSELCWEAEFHPRQTNQHIQYFLATQNNFDKLVCVPLNAAGDSFCQSQAQRDDGPDTQVEGQDAYTIHY